MTTEEHPTGQPRAARRMSEVKTAGVDYAVKVPFLSLVGEELTIETVQWREGDKGDYVIMTGHWGELLIVTVTGGEIVMRKLLSVEGELPIIVKVTRTGRAFDLE